MGSVFIVGMSCSKVPLQCYMACVKKERAIRYQSFRGMLRAVDGQDVDETSVHQLHQSLVETERVSVRLQWDVVRYPLAVSGVQHWEMSLPSWGSCIWEVACVSCARKRCHRFGGMRKLSQKSRYGEHRQRGWGSGPEGDVLRQGVAVWWWAVWQM